MVMMMMMMVMMMMRRRRGGDDGESELTSYESTSVNCFYFILLNDD